MNSKFSRRQLFKLRFADVGNLVRQARQSLTEKHTAQQPPKEVAENSPAEALGIIHPPGALLDQNAFLNICERCHACADACPYPDVIRFFPASDGKLEGSPLLSPSEAPCRWCYDYPCINACPSQALLLPEEDEHHKRTPRPIAKVVLDLDTCLNNQGTLCDTCALMCPPHIKAIKMINRQPQIDPELCTGCGMCAYYCESEPRSITSSALPHQ